MHSEEIYIANEYKGRTIGERLCILVATGFGIGLYAPFAPGTFGSLPGVLMAYLTTRMPLSMQVPFCLALTLAAIPVCDQAERLLAIKDDSRISADEWLLFPIALIGIPLWNLPWWAMVVFFCVVRAVDVINPPPAKALQTIPGGRGIVIDDFIANLYALAINWAIYLAVW